MTSHWKVRENPSRLEGRLEFPDYRHTRGFLDEAAKLSQQTGFYPDMSFGRTYVNLSLYLDARARDFTEAQRRYARLVDDLVG